MYADAVDELWNDIRVYRGMLLWNLWKALPIVLPYMRVSRMDVSIEVCGICGGSTLGGILGGLSKLIPVLGWGGE